MIRKLIAFSINNAALVLLATALLVALTVWQTRRMTVDVFPELNAPMVVILTEAGGLSSLEVEQYVTFPIESAMGGLPGVRRVRSSSAMSLSLVYVEFDWGVDIYRARQVVGESLDTVREQLPEDVHTEMAPISGVIGEIMLVSLTSPGGEASPLQLRALGEFDLRQRLLAVPGVAQVVAIGGELPEYQVLVDQDRLRLYDLTLHDVVEAARQAHSIEGAGYLPDVEGMEVSLLQTARVADVADVRQTIVRYHEGTPVTLGDVAEVRMGPTPPRGVGAQAGSPAVIMGVKKAPFTNTLEVTAGVDAALDDMEAALPEGVVLDRHVFRQSDFIDRSLDNVTHVLRDAALFVAIVLVLFLMNVRTTLITLTAIPLSVGVALLVMGGVGMSLNVMTLGGLAIAIGELVDDAIIDVENVYRRLKENAALPVAQRRETSVVIFEASNEVRTPIVFATTIIVLVFVPLLFLQGLEGRFFRPMGLAYIASILASLFVALTVVPALCRLLLGHIGRPGKGADEKAAESDGGEERDSFVVRQLKRVYAPVLRAALRFRRTVLATAAGITVASVALVSTFGSDFLPAFNEGTLMVFAIAPPGTSLDESDRMVSGLGAELAQVEGVRTAARRTGRAERDEHAHGPEVNEFIISLEPGADVAEVRHRIDDVLAQVPALSVSTGAPIAHQLSTVLSGTQANLAINVYGEDLETLRAIAGEIDQVLRDVPGARDVIANREARLTALPIRYRRADLARWGMTAAGAAEQVKTAFDGRVVDTINDGIRLYDLTVRLAPEARDSFEDVSGFQLRSPSGGLVRLHEVATVEPDLVPLGVQRENGRRKAVISLNVAEGYNLGDLVQDVRQRVEPIVESYGYSVTFGGTFEAQQSASRTILIMGGFTALAVLMLLSTAFGSVRAALLVMVNLPLALIGGVVAIYVTAPAGAVSNTLGLVGMGTYEPPIVSIASMVGFVTLFGIAVRNGLLLVNHYMDLQRDEGASFDEAITRGSEERLVPILMTALTAVLGLVPLAMAAGEPGSELLAPLAIVVLGGLVTSTLLNLIVVPAGYDLIFRNHPIERSASDPAVDPKSNDQ